MKKTALAAIMLGVLSLSAATGKHEMELSLFDLARNYYSGMETLYRKAEQDTVTVEDIDAVLEPLRKKAESVSGAVIGDLKQGDQNSFNALVELYNSHIGQAPELREPFNLAVENIVEYRQAAEGPGRTYFPGYGYSEDGPYGYKYRKTRELSREIVAVFWKKIDQTIEEGKTKRLTLDVKLAASFDPTALLTAVGVPFEIKVDGEMKMVCEYEVTTKKNTTTACNRKFQTVKVWFQLQRAKKVWPFWGSWKDCGQTYDMIEEESNLPVTDQATVS
ncbi:MAG: hypothetical protein PHQ23_03295 [Candidatus Wallbacteria bacterium]|nr:hypothetical protein [Candidatus Wallbacteria bacterium]